jgi:transcriptional regulator with XRE-family HTH domain
MDEGHPAAHTPEEAEQTAGERLKAARERQGLSLKQVAQQTLQSSDLLHTLESMQTSALAPTVLRMHVRTYARALGLPEDELADGFAGPVFQQPPEAPLGPRFSSLHHPAPSQLLPLAGGAVALILIGLAVLALPGRGSHDVHAPVSSKVENAVAQTSTLFSETGLKGPELAIHAVRPALIEVRASDGTVFRNRRMSAGEIYYPRLGSGWTVTVQDAGAFEWRLDDLRVDSFGEAGVPAYGVSVDEALRRGIETVSDAMAESGEGRQRSR